MSEVKNQVDNVQNRFAQFSKEFVRYFLKSLQDEHSVAVKDAKVTKINTGAQLAGKTVGAALGAGAGVLTGVFGVVAGIKVGAKIGDVVARKIGQKQGQENAQKINELLGDQISGSEMAAKFKQFLIEFALQIFRNYEYQMVNVTSKSGWSLAMNILAKDAVERIMGYLVKAKEEGISSEMMTKGLVQGKSQGFLAKGETLVNKQGIGNINYDH